jgi:glutathione S-transferase
MAPKLVYFAVRGRSQSLRYLVRDLDIPLEEEHVDFSKWPSVKPTTPFGQLPVLHDGELQIAQSNAILRYFARKHGLYGKNDVEAVTIDMLNDTQEDFRLGYLKLIYQQYDQEKDNYIKALPEKLAVFETHLKKNHNGQGFFVGDKISFIDYQMFDILDNHLLLAPHSLDAFPALKAFHGRIAAHDKIAKYRASDEFKKMPVNGNGKQ